MTGLVVEMIGLCGAGKTTLAGKLVPLLADAGKEEVFHVLSRPAPSGYRALFAAACIALSAGRRSSQALHFLANREGRGLTLKLGYRQAGLKGNTTERPTLIAESGVLQPIISFEAELNLDGIRFPYDAFMDALALPDIVIRVDAPVETAFARYTARQNQDGRPSRGSIETFRRAMTALDTLCTSLSERGREIIRFSSTGPMGGQSVDTLAGELRDRISRRPAA